MITGMPVPIPEPEEMRHWRAPSLPVQLAAMKGAQAALRPKGSKRAIILNNSLNHFGRVLSYSFVDNKNSEPFWAFAKLKKEAPLICERPRDDLFKGYSPDAGVDLLSKPVN